MNHRVHGTLGIVGGRETLMGGVRFQQKLLLKHELWQQQAQQLVQTLTPEQQKQWGHWGERLSPSIAWKAMLSKQYRSNVIPITPEKAWENNKRFGGFVNTYMAREVEDCLRERVFERDRDPLSSHKLVKIGCGTGLGVEYLEKAAQFLDLEIYDWVPIALEYVEEALRDIINAHGLDEEAIFQVGEASQVCQALDTSVRIFEMIRVDEHMSDEDAAKAFQGAGQILADKRNRVIEAGARRGGLNDLVPVQTCNHRDPGFAIHHLQIGARRTLSCCYEEKFQDIEKEFTFRTIRAEFEL